MSEFQQNSKRKIKKLQILLTSCNGCPHLFSSDGQMVSCNRYNQNICSTQIIKVFLKKNKFPDFCKLMDVDEIIVEEEKETQPQIQHLN